MTRGTERSSRRWLATLAAAALLVAAGTWAYSNGFSGVLVFDDIASITTNPHIKSLSPGTALSAPQDTTVAGRPAAALSLALNYALAPVDVRDALTPPRPDTPPEEVARFLRNVWGYHALNLVIHLLAGLTLFGIVRRSLQAGRLRARFVAAATPLAFVVALVWLVHPLNTESVTYVVQRVEALMGLFYLLTLYCAIRASESGSPKVRQSGSQSHAPTPGRPDARTPGRLTAGLWGAAAIVACALGMGSKEVMVTAPIAVFLWDWLIGNAEVAGPRGFSPKAPTGRQAVTPTRLRWRLYAGLAATWLILIVLAATNPRPHSVGFGLGGWTPWNYLQTQAGVVAHYLRLAVVPSPLVFDYEWQQATSFAAIAPHALLLLALFGITVFAVLRRHPAAFPGAWFFLILAPTSSVVPIPTEVAAEHRMYLPLIGVIVLAVLALFSLTARAFGGVKAGRAGGVSGADAPGLKPGGPTSSSQQRGWRNAAIVLTMAVGVVIAVVFGTLTYARNQDYGTDEVLMRDTVEKRPLNIRARVAYGADLLAARRFADAEAQLVVAARLEGSDKAHAQANMYLGSALCAQGKIAEGIAHLEQALALDRTLTDAHALLGEAYASRGDTRLAVEHFEQALEGMPDNAAVLRRAAWLLATSPDGSIRNGRRAAELAERAVRLTERRDVIALEALMAAYAESERFAEASAIGREALALAQAQGNALFAGGLQQEIALCEAGQKIRDGR